MKHFYNQSLKHYNTFRVEANTQEFIEIEHLEELDYLYTHRIFDKKFLLIGEGSNVLFTTDFEGAIIRLALRGIEITHETDDEVWLKVSAGETWDNFITYCIQNHYYGIENLIAIPGWVGSAPVQNIGAYGVEVKDVIERVEGFYIKDKTPFRLGNNQCAFGYRDSIFKNQLKNRCLITTVHFKLSKKEHYTLSYKALVERIKKSNQPLSLTSITENIFAIRNDKLPDITKIGNAGSFFKNPTILKQDLKKLLARTPNLVFYEVDSERAKLSAAQLIDICGCKEWRQGDVAVYPSQPLVLVNYGNASGKELYAFSQKIAEIVRQQFDIQLEREVNVVF